MNFGKLICNPVHEHMELVAEPVRVYVAKNDELAKEIWVGEIDAGLADTTAFCEHYAVGLELSANCVIVEAKRGDGVWYAACVILATTKADVNGVIRRQLGARKTSFASMEKAVFLSHMEYGGITPIGLPDTWPIFVDTRVAQTEKVIIGSGIRGSKLVVPGSLLAELPLAVVMDVANDKNVLL